MRTSFELKNRVGLFDYRAFLEKEVVMCQFGNDGMPTENNPTLKPGIAKNPFWCTEGRDRHIERRREFLETEILGFVP